MARKLLKKLFGAFEKVEEQEDGTLKVYGYASSEAVDADGEIVKSTAISNAIPDYMRFGAVREMHQAKAAGTALEMRVEDDGRTYFGAHVVDSEAVKKVAAGVYKGFSIGGKVTERDALVKTTITGLKLTEVSLVDRPANPEAVFTMYKADGVDPDAELSEPLRKGLWSVGRLASLLSDVQYLAQDTAWEAEYEGDGSGVPAQLRAWLGDGVTILTAMVAEEGAEAVASVPASPAAVVVDVVTLAAPTGDLAKVADAALADDERLVQLVAKTLKAARDEDLAKAISTAVEKATADLVEKNAALVKRVDELAAQPAPAKGAVRAVPITKAEDGSALSDPPAAAPDPADPLALTKAAMARPLAVGFGGRPVS